MSYCTSCGGDHRTCDCKGKADPAPAAAPVGAVEPIDIYTPMLWVTTDEDARYEEYIRVRQAAVAIQAEHARLAQELARCEEGYRDQIELFNVMRGARDAALTRAQEAEQQHAESLAAYGEVLGDLEAARSALAQAEKERDTERSRFAYYAERFETLASEIGRQPGEWGHLRYQISAAITTAAAEFKRYAAGQLSPSNWRKRAEKAEQERDELRAALASRETALASLTRYELDDGEQVCIPRDDGAWVLREDIEALITAWKQAHAAPARTRDS